MSDPVTNVEIEDVLTSIRRLVAEGEKSRVRRVDGPSEAPVRPDRLVLTPALRVDPGETESDPAEAAPDVQPVAETPTALDDADGVAFDRDRLEQSAIPFDRARLEATIAELEAAVTAQAEDWEPDGSETDTEPTWARAGFPSDQPVEDAIEIAEDSSFDAELLADADEATDDSPEIAAVAEAAPEPEPLQLGEAAAVFASARARVGLVTPPRPEPVRTPEPAAAPEPEAAIAAPEPQADMAGDDAPLNEMPVDEPAPAAMRFHHTPDRSQDEDADYGDDLRELDDDPVADIEAFLEKETLMDEAALRQMVLEIVREELQGRLGERITRNVRKLVRREIHRVLTSQDLD